MLNKENFIAEVDRFITCILEKKDSWHGINIYEIERCVKIHNFCLILGEGGIGKKSISNRLR